MKVIKQILSEMKILLKSKFIMISLCLAVIGINVVPHIITIVFPNDVVEYNGINNEVEVDGVKYPYNSFSSSLSESFNIINSSEFKQESTADIVALDFGEKYIEFLTLYSPQIDYKNDYKADIAYQGIVKFIEQYILENPIYTADELILGIDTIAWIPSVIDKDDVTELINLSEEDRISRLEKLDIFFDKFHDVMMEEDYAIFYELMLDYYNERVIDNNEGIKSLEEAIMEGKITEASVQQEIETITYFNEFTLMIEIPRLIYRFENNIVEWDNSWQNNALSDIADLYLRIKDTEIIEEKDFLEDESLVKQHGNHLNYIMSQVSERELLEESLLIAELSLENKEPDLKYAVDGARNKVNYTFGFNIFVVMIAVLIGGYMIADEFSSGTIRVLMIRPKSRVKILLSKFLAGFLLIFLVYILIFVVNIIFNGILFGFSDYAYPSYSISGEGNFFIILLIRILISLVSILFIYTLSFTLPVVTRNIALSIIIPTMLSVSYYVVLRLLLNRSPIELVTYTPLPYLNLQEAFTTNSFYTEMSIKYADINLTNGIFILLVYSLILIAIAIYDFNKRDITN